MDAPFTTVGEALRSQLSEPQAPRTTVLEGINSGFAAIDAMKEGAAEIDAPEEAPRPTPAARPEPKVADSDGRMAKIMAQAQKVRQEREQFAAERAQHETDLAELARYRQLKSIAKEDPVAWAEEGGYKPDEYATTLMEKGSLNPERRKILEQQRELNDMKAWRASVEQQQAEQQKQGYYNNVRRDMEAMAEANAEQYDLVRRTGSYDKVLSKITEHYQLTAAAGEAEILPYEDAFAAVERELEEYYSPVLESPKFRSKFASDSVSSAPAATLKQPAARKSPGTINSKFKAQSSAPRPLGEQERLSKAGELFLSQLYGRRG